MALFQKKVKEKEKETEEVAETETENKTEKTFYQSRPCPLARSQRNAEKVIPYFAIVRYCHHQPQLEFWQ